MRGELECGAESADTAELTVLAHERARERRPTGNYRRLKSFAFTIAI